jgi:phosphatidylglycerol:prolipoprotein diacylglycerol transferase
MLPILFRCGPLTIHTYGVLVAAGFLLAYAYVLRAARRHGIETEAMADLFFYALLSALVGARLLYVALNWRLFLYDPLAVVKIWQGGLVFYGGFVAAVPVVAWRVRRLGLGLLVIADMAAPALALAQAVGRLGCLCAGCCYGRPTELPFAVIFHHPDSLAPLEQPLHPTQAYHAAANGLLFVILWQTARRRPRPGLVAGLYLLLYPVGRFVIEFFRGDPRGAWAGLSTSQWVSMAVFSAGAAWMAYVRRRAAGAESHAG